jgi:hypothetical protein
MIYQQKLKSINFTNNFIKPELMSKIFKKGNERFIFLIIPLLLFVFIAVALNEKVHFYYSWYDPVYAYLMNGLTFALGSVDIGHTDHPGTPLQLFCALIIKLVSLFRRTDDIAVDVLTHTELYILIITSLLIVINGISLIVIGLNAYKTTHNKYISLLIQLSPLFAFKAILFMPVLATETVLIFLSVFLASIIILKINIEENNYIFKVLLLSFLSGLIVSTKISAIPVIAIPFFFIRGWKRKLLFLLTTLSISFLFILPVLPKMGRFLEFISNIFTHTGKYGGGQEGIIDWSMYFDAIKKVLIEEIPFLFHIILIFIGWIFILVKKVIAPAQKRILLGMTVSTLIGILVVSRHYSFHYLIPVYVISMPLQVFFWYSIFEKDLKRFSFTKLNWLMLILILLVFFRIVVKYNFYPGMKNPVINTVNEIKNKNLSPFVIFNKTSKGTAFIEPALNFGLAYTGSEIRPKYRFIFAEYFSGNYLWNSRDGIFDWQRSYLVYDLFYKHKTLYLYNKSEDYELSCAEIQRMIENYGLTNLVKTERIYENSISGEIIVKAENDTANIKKLVIPDETIVVTMEELTSDGEYFIDESGKRFFEGGRHQSKRYVYEGYNSLLLTSSHRFGLKTELHVEQNEWFRLGAWQKSILGKSAVFVISAENSKCFYKSSNTEELSKNEWSYCEFVFRLPEDYTDSTVNCYIYLPVNDSIWIDNFVIDHFVVNNN